MVHSAAAAKEKIAAAASDAADSDVCFVANVAEVVDVAVPVINDLP